MADRVWFQAYLPENSLTFQGIAPDGITSLSTLHQWLIHEAKAGTLTERVDIIRHEGNSNRVQCRFDPSLVHTLRKGLLTVDMGQ